MTDRTTDELREKIAWTLEGQGLSAHPDQYDSNIHGWRCEYPDRYGPCSCFEELVAAVLSDVEAEVRRAQAEVWDAATRNALNFAYLNQEDRITLYLRPPHDRNPYTDDEEPTR